MLSDLKTELLVIRVAKVLDGLSIAEAERILNAAKACIKEGCRFSTDSTEWQGRLNKFQFAGKQKNLFDEAL